MRKLMQAIRPSLTALSRSSLYIAGAGIIAMTVIVGWQVFARYVLNDSPSWSEPLSLYLMSWFIMLGAAVGVRESVHLGLDILRYSMPVSVQKTMDLVSLGLVTLFGIAMAYYGVLLAKGTWTATIPVLGWPGGVDFFPLIVGGAMIALFAAERFIDVALGEEIAAHADVAEVV
ncbi:TRAP-type C4-dicarboxylate transport system permease small subunit [Neorhizobium galegae]|uniref:TRAP transporter small permease n=1 Tax=Neorhizobium galegae TaxID=399 RepID=UPI001AEA2729|nr:TRAP transporter small permease [Neorhizobium galegae]MBP2550493.1 TRAP-type C4-dicarboxylate transport system permease small subunit [Neorhizobium galegae]